MSLKVNSTSFVVVVKNTIRTVLILEEFEKWQMYGLYAVEETRHSVWLEVTNVLGVLNVAFEKCLIDHLSITIFFVYVII